ncbi:hypothetical protein [Salinibacterium sp. ZJ70]|uniref:hypothetical protein n=1 Tax=Salinibacterium sp. ZJ70 TaxID=2708084 RepID=UPI001CD73D6C|nr:hypothetical protein [Salinibacterium sp. ZJ70]
MLKRTLLVGSVFGAVLTLALPFVGGAGPSLEETAHAGSASERPVAATASVASMNPVAKLAATVRLDDTAVTVASIDLTVDREHIAQKPVPPPPPPVVETPAAKRAGTAARQAARAAAGQRCPAPVGGSTAGAPGQTSAAGVGGTTSADLQSFAETFNAIRVANCLEPIPMSNIRYDSCLEARLFWIAEDPSEDTSSAWGHNGTQRSDGVPATGCDGNLAGGSGNTGATVAQKWWNSASHQKSLYRLTHTGSASGVVICFAMVHGGVPADPYSFTRAAARWGGC